MYVFVLEIAIVLWISYDAPFQFCVTLFFIFMTFMAYEKNVQKKTGRTDDTLEDKHKL